MIPLIYLQVTKDVLCDSFTYICNVLLLGQCPECSVVWTTQLAAQHLLKCYLLAIWLWSKGLSWSRENHKALILLQWCRQSCCNCVLVYMIAFCCCPWLCMQDVLFFNTQLTAKICQVQMLYTDGLNQSCPNAYHHLPPSWKENREAYSSLTSFLSVTSDFEYGATCISRWFKCSYYLDIPPTLLQETH